MKEIGIIDYGVCNLDSMARAVERCGGTPIVTNRAEDIERVSGLILPGVGAFSRAMENLTQLHLIETLKKEVEIKKTPVLGVCLGMQLFAERGTEGGDVSGLGWIPGTVERLAKSPHFRVPHVGWNNISFNSQSSLFFGVETNKDFYFVHSYQFNAPGKYITGHVDHGGPVPIAVERENIYGVQFHPEKSQKAGFQVIRNFIDLC